MKKRSKFSLRIFIRIFLLILPLNSICHFSLYATYRAVQKQAETETEKLLSNYMTQIDFSIEKALNNLYTLSNSFSFLCIEQPKADSVSVDQYTMMRAQNEVSVTFRSWLTEHDIISGYFFINPELDIRIFDSKNTSVLKDASQYIEDTISRSDISDIVTKWSSHADNGKPALYCLIQNGPCHYGMWIDSDEWFDCLGLNIPEDYGMLVNKNNPYGSTPKLLVTSSQPDLPLCLYASADKHQVSLQRFTKIIILISFLTLSTIPLLWWLINREIIRPLRQLQLAIHNIEEGQLDYKIPNTKPSGSEFQQLNLSFNHIIDMFKELKMESYELQISQRETQVKYLTQQIQPHFIINALNTLYCYDKDQYPLMQRMILCLSRYFRYIVKIPNPYTTLFQEIEHLKNYLDIQEMRYSSSTQSDIRYDPALKHLKIPPLVIQTFVENSLKYATSPEQVTKIIVHVFLQDETAVIRIKDSGPGFPHHILKEIQSFLCGHVVSGELGTGICNVIERLNILYTGQAEIRISNYREGGAFVEIFIPKEFICEIEEEW